MKFKPYKISPLNESLLGNTNMEYPADDIEVKGAVPVDFAAAIDEHQKRVEKGNETFKEFKKKAEEFVEENHNREVKGETTAEMKELKLAESLFEDVAEEGKFDKYIGQFGSGPCAPTSHLTYWKRHLDDATKHLNDERYGEIAEKEVCEALDNIKLNLQEFVDFNRYWTKHYELVRQAFNQVIENADVKMGMPESLVDVDVPITANVTANGNTVPFMNGSAKTEDVDPDFFEVNGDDILTEAPVAVMEPEVKKKRHRSPNEKPDIADYSSEDLWYAVYDELSATTDNEGEGKTVNKQLKARRGERYEQVYPHGDTDLIVYAMKPEDFEFAKKVADHYGVVAEEPKEDKNPATNGYYKYSMVIRIPADELYTY